MTIDIKFNFGRDTPEGKDPDTHSPTLQRYHRCLWSKPLPSGTFFGLDNSTERGKLHLRHKSEMGEFTLSSDSIGHTYSRTKEKKVVDVVKIIPENEIKQFHFICSTIGAYIIFPAKQINRKQTINQVRGFNRKIIDRFDLTLECIRRFYLKEDSPLSDDLKRYKTFFRLFEDFKGYTNFFLLQDLVKKDYSSINYFLPFDGFGKYPLPAIVDEYLLYKDRVMAFIKKRSHRMLNSVDSARRSCR